MCKGLRSLHDVGRETAWKSWVQLWMHSGLVAMLSFVTVYLTNAEIGSIEADGWVYLSRWAVVDSILIWFVLSPSPAELFYVD